MKLSKKGEQIYKLILNSNGHMTAEEIHDVLKQENINMGIATIYRNLNTLYNLKYINRVRHPELGYIYDRNTEVHYHFYCKDTKQIYDLDLEYQKELDILVEKLLGVKVSSHSIIFEGTTKKKMNK